MVGLLAALLPFGGTITAFGIPLTTAAGGLTLAGSLVNFAGASLLNNVAARLSRPKVGATQIKAQLAVPQTDPVVRFVYGETRAMGSPLALAVNGDYIYGAWLLNSRPSALPDAEIYINQAPVALTGDIFAFSGAGASAPSGTYQDHIQFWIGRGDQTQPPQEFLDNCAWSVARPDWWKAEDAFTGLTVLFAKVRAGSADNFSTRWPSQPPQFEVLGRFSKVYDPREAGHDLTDPDTWEWSNNHALCSLDALTQFPTRPYTPAFLSIDAGPHNFADGADADDETMAKADGGTEPRATCNGTLIFSDGQELEDVLQPLMDSGGARFTMTGQKRGYVPAAYVAPSVTVADFISPISFRDMEGEVPTHLDVSYTNVERGYETANLARYAIPGAPAGQRFATLDLPFCTSPTQAMRIRKIAGYRLTSQRSIQGTLFPEAINAVAGANISVNTPFAPINGVYQVTSIAPAFSPLGDEGVALQLPVTLEEHSAAPYAWTTAEEEEILVQPYDPTRSEIQPPGNITVETGDGVNLNTGGVITPRARFLFDPSTSAATQGYGWRFREDGEAWQDGGTISPDALNGSGKLVGYLSGSVETTYDIEVWATSGGERSSSQQITGVQMVVSIALDLPTIDSATGGAGEITVEITAPADNDVLELELWGSDTDDEGAASQLGGQITAVPGVTYTIVETGLGSGVTRYYFARSRGAFSSASAFTASVSATTT